MLSDSGIDDENAADGSKNGFGDQKDSIPFGYGIVVRSDIPEEAKRREIVDICQIACEKFAAAEKPPLDRDNQAAAEMIKVERKKTHKWLSRRR